MSESIQDCLQRLGVAPGTWSPGGKINPKDLKSLASLRTLLTKLDESLGEQIQKDTDKLLSLREQKIIDGGSN